MTHYYRFRKNNQNMTRPTFVIQFDGKYRFFGGNGNVSL